MRLNGTRTIQYAEIMTAPPFDSSTYPLVAFPVPVNFAIDVPPYHRIRVPIPGDWRPDQEGIVPEGRPSVTITVGQVPSDPRYFNVRCIRWLRSLTDAPESPVEPFQYGNGKEDSALIDYVLDLETQNHFLDTDTSDYDIFTRCLAAANRFISAYAVASESPYVYFLTRERLDPFQLCDYRHATGKSESSTEARPIHDNVDRLGQPETLDPSRRQMLAFAMSHEVLNHPMDPQRIWYTKANRARHVVGDYEQAVIYFQIAAECLLEAISRLILVANGNTSAQIEVAVESKKNLPQVMAFVSEHMGGNWDRNGSGPVGIFWSDLCRLRNDVGHHARHVTETEMDSAQAAYEQFQEFVFSRVMSSAARFPRVAFGVLGGEGILRRGGLTRRLVEWSEQEDGQPGPFWMPVDQRSPIREPEGTTVAAEERVGLREFISWLEEGRKVQQEGSSGEDETEGSSD